MKLSHRISQWAVCLALGSSALGVQSAIANEAHAPSASPDQHLVPFVATGPQAFSYADLLRAPGQAKVASVNVEVIVLHATNDGTGIDPKIGKIAELSKPPFSSYNSYKLLDRPKLAIEKGKEAKTKLPNDRELAVAFKDLIAPKKKDDPTRYVISASIQKPGGNTFLPLLEVNAKAGEWFFVAGQTYKGGILVIGIKVLP